MLLSLGKFYITAENEGLADELRGMGLGKVDNEEYLVCKKCGRKISPSDADIYDGIWHCQEDHANRLDQSKKGARGVFIWDFQQVKGKIRTRLEDVGRVTDNESHWILESDGKRVPVLLLESPSSSALNILAVQYGGLVIYLSEDEKREVANAFSVKNFIFIRDFLASEADSLRETVKQLDLDYSYPDILKAEEEIGRIRDFREFETEVNSLLDSMKRNKESLKQLLDLLQKHEGNVLGTKFVHIGSNYPADVMPIALYSYISKFLEVWPNSAYDAKLISDNLTYDKFLNKINTNPGRQLAFITSARKVDSKIWRRVIEAKDNNSGRWVEIVIDYDTLVLLWAYVKKK